MELTRSSIALPDFLISNWGEGFLSPEEEEARLPPLPRGIVFSSRGHSREMASIFHGAQRNAAAMVAWARRTIYSWHPIDARELYNKLTSTTAHRSRRRPVFSPEKGEGIASLAAQSWFSFVLILTRSRASH